jgi:hypothetical protein
MEPTFHTKADNDDSALGTDNWSIIYFELSLLKEMNLTEEYMISFYLKPFLRQHQRFQ